ncbi:MAG: leucine-rich repeat protein, partial [Planctomycetes bacterium]|nr:leucine-rich repeat protein [Planctomycetota bacterium]
AKNRDERPPTGDEAARQLRFLEAGLGFPALMAIPFATPINDSGIKSPPDPWEALGENETQIDGVPVADEPSIPRLQRRADSEFPRKRPWLLIASLIAFVAVTAVAADIIIKIKNRDGSETEIKVPNGSKVAVNGVDVTPKGTEPKKDLPKSADSDGAVATWVLSMGGVVRVNGQDNLITRPNELPPEPLKLTFVEIQKNNKLTDADLTRLKDCKNLEGLVLSHCSNVTGAGWTQLRDWKNLRHLHFGNTGITNEALAPFKECKNLTFLDLGHTLVSDAGLANFKGSQNLVTLLLGYTNVTDNGLANFKDCKDLTDLSVDGTIIGDAGLAHLKECKKLRSMQLTRTLVSDQSVPFLQTQVNLTQLLLPQTDVTPEGLAILKKALPNTQVYGGGGVRLFDHRLAAHYAIQLGGKVTINNQQVEIAARSGLPNGPFELTGIQLTEPEKVTPHDLAPFKGCGTLKSLGLGHTSVTDGGLATFKECDKLTKVYLDGTKITDAGLAQFKGSKHLRELYLNSTKVSDLGLSYLKECNNLTQVWLDDTRVTDAGLANFKECRNLTTLNVRNKFVVGTGAKELAKTLPLCKIGWTGSNIEMARDQDCEAAVWVLSLGGLVRVDDKPALLKAAADLPPQPFRLTHVELRENKFLTDAGLLNLKNCRSLTSLWLSDTLVTDAGLAAFKDWKTLEWLVLGGCKNVTDQGLTNFKDCKNLTDLWLNETQVTNAGLASFKDCQALTHLELINTQVGDAGLANFKNCKKLKEVWLNGSKVGDAGLAYLRECTALTQLNVRKTKVTAAGIADLRKAVAECKIEWDERAP